MKRFTVSLAAVAAFGVASMANAQPVKLSKVQLDKVVAAGQQHFPPGQFPAGNPAKAPGKSNTPGNSR